MKKSNQEDPNAKALRDRYADLLGLENDGFVEKEIIEESPTRWYAFLFILLLIASGAWFLFDAYMNDQNTRPTADRNKPEIAQAPTDAAMTPAPANSEVTESIGPSIEENDLTDLEELVSERITESIDTISEAGDIDGQTPETDLPNQDEAERQIPGDDQSVLLVVLSTKSKNEAIDRARILVTKGYPGEVILSSSGYYGVVIRNETYEQAKKVEKAATDAGIFTAKPYLMDTNRVKEWVFTQKK